MLSCTLLVNQWNLKYIFKIIDANLVFLVTQLIEEYEQYGDIIVEGFLDTYLNLTLKTSFGLKWIEKNCPNADFVLKVIIYLLFI